MISFLIKSILVTTNSINEINNNKISFLLIKIKLSHINRIGNICGLKENERKEKNKILVNKKEDKLFFSIDKETLRTLTIKKINNVSLKMLGINQITEGRKKI